jgi:hypothetical protein
VNVQEASEFAMAGYSDTKENSTTPIPKKTPKNRRRSVCVTATPNRKFSAEELKQCTNRLGTPETNIVREELNFSPQPSVDNSASNKTSPELSGARNKTPPSFNETEYETFAKAVPMNSTVLTGTRKLPKFLIDDEAQDIGDEDDDDEETDEDGNQSEEADVEGSETDAEDSEADVEGSETEIKGSEADVEAQEADEDQDMTEDNRLEKVAEAEADAGDDVSQRNGRDLEDGEEACSDDNHNVSEIQTGNTRRHRRAVIQSSDEEQDMEQVCFIILQKKVHLAKCRYGVANASIYAVIDNLLRGLCSTCYQNVIFEACFT